MSSYSATHLDDIAGKFAVASHGQHRMVRQIQLRVGRAPVDRQINLRSVPGLPGRDGVDPDPAAHKLDDASGERHAELVPAGTRIIRR